MLWAIPPRPEYIWRQGGWRPLKACANLQVLAAAGTPRGDARGGAGFVDPHRGRVQDAPVSPHLTVLIPCYNEERRIADTVPRVVAHLETLSCTWEVVLVDDGSSDGTWAQLEGFTRELPGVRAVRQAANGGKGRALAAGVQAARGEVVLFFDADLSYPLAYIAEALAAIDGGADVVAGARDLDAAGRADYSLVRKAFSTAFNGLVDLVLGLGIPDTQCGFKAFRADVARALFGALTIGRFGFDVELLYLVRRWNLVLVRMPIVMVHRPGSTVRVIPDSLQMFRDIVRIRRQAARYPARPEELTPRA